MPDSRQWRPATSGQDPPVATSESDRVGQIRGGTECGRTARLWRQCPVPVATKALRLLEYAEYSLSTFERSFANTCALSAAIDARRLDWAVRQLLAQPLRRLTVFGARGA